jgi:lysophospholipase L1-like esterase
MRARARLVRTLLLRAAMRSTLLASSLAVAAFGLVTSVSSLARAQAHVTCVGDSITAGNGASSPTAAYPSVLQGLLGSSYAVENDGQSGATLSSTGDLPYVGSDLLKTSTQWAAAGGDVVIELGTNDSKAINWKGAPAFLADCEALVRRYAEGPGTPRVWVSLVPPASSTACCDIDAGLIASTIVPLLKTCAAETGAASIDVHGALAGRVDLLVDGVHPNDEGARIIARTVHDALVKAPVVGLAVTPAPGASALTLTASPQAAYGKITKVVFYDGADVAKEVTASPWSFTLEGAKEGEHVFRAETFETGGRKAESPPVTATVAGGQASVPQPGGDGAQATGPGSAGSAPRSTSGCATGGAGLPRGLAGGGLALLLLGALARARRARSSSRRRAG